MIYTMPNYITRGDGVVIKQVSAGDHVTHRLRQNETGRLYAIALDPEDSPYTYTEMEPVPDAPGQWREYVEPAEETEG